MSKGKIFLTGGAGFIGSHVVKNLLAKGYEVRCLVRSSTNTRRIDSFAIEKHLGDIQDLASLQEGMKGCAGVIHLASITNWKDIQSPRMCKVVVEGSQNVLVAAQQSGHLKTVYVSSASAIDGTSDKRILNEDSPFTLPLGKHYSYAVAKKEVEGVCLAKVKEGQSITIVNPTEVYGPYDYDRVTCGNLIDFLSTPIVQLAKGGTSIVHVEDVAQGIVAALEKGRSGERYILGSDNLEFHELAQLTLDLAGSQKKISVLPRQLLLTLAWASRTFKIHMGFEPAVIPYAVKYWFIDNTKAKNELGIQFRGAKEILEPTIRWMKEEGMV